MQNQLVWLTVFSVMLLLCNSQIQSIAEPKVQALGPPKTVNFVNIEKYLGVWYQISYIPYFAQFGCSKTKAQYSKNEDGSIKVKNTCVRNLRVTETIGKAVAEDSTNTKLFVGFFGLTPLKSNYWIVRLADDYSYAVVSSPDYQLLWILFRKPQMPDQLYNNIINDLKKDGYRVERLVKIQQ